MNTTPFGFAVVDKDGNRERYLSNFELGTGICEWLDWYKSKNAPHRIVELYTKEQIVPILKGLLRGDCFCEMAVGNPMCKSHDSGCKAATAFLHSIIESSSDEKGSV